MCVFPVGFGAAIIGSRATRRNAAVAQLALTIALKPAAVARTRHRAYTRRHGDTGRGRRDAQ
jgi:hypothetical protein